jgi:hypothetical protein
MDCACERASKRERERESARARERESEREKERERASERERATCITARASTFSPAPFSVEAIFFLGSVPAP